MTTGGDTLACCSINIIEVYAGMRENEERAAERLLHSLALYPITFPIARLAGLLKRDYSKRGKVLTLADATIAIHNGFPLITDNPKDFPMKELQIHSL